MTTVLIVLAVIFAAPLLYLATLDGSYTVKRSLEIGASRFSRQACASGIFDTVGDSYVDSAGWLKW